MRILIADDDPVSCSLLDRLLHKRGYEVIAARNGTDAWEVLQADPAPRVALLDWMMPGIDGVETPGAGAIIATLCVHHAPYRK